MSRYLIEHALINSLLAFVIAIATVVIGRWARNALVDRTLCLGILLKLVTPAFLLIPVMTPQRPVSGTVRDVPAPSFPGVNTFDPPFEDEITQQKHPAASPQFPTPAVDSPFTSMKRSEPASPNIASRFRIRDLSLMSGLVLGWMTVSMVLLALVIIRSIRFQRFLFTCSEHEVPPALREAITGFSDEMTPGHAAHLKVVDGVFSPFAWTWFRHTTIVIPARLLDELTFAQQQMITVHELVHIRRHDLHLRWFETLVHCLYWWSPIVPWVRRRLHLAQEYCCDAEVARRFPALKEDYTEALYRTANWVMNEKRAPGLAVEFSRTSTLKRRIQNLLQPQISDNLSRREKLYSLVGVALCLMISIQFVKAENPHLPPAALPNNQRHSIELNIIDAAGKPIADGTVVVSGEDSRRTPFKHSIRIEKGIAGFSLTSPRVNRIKWNVESAGFMAHTQQFHPSPKLTHITLNARYIVRLKEGITIGGRVVDASGNPVANARVHARTDSQRIIDKTETMNDERTDHFDRRTSTNEQGEWSLAEADPELPHFCFSISDSHESDPGQLQVVRPEELDGLKNKTDVRTLEPSVERVVHVQDESGHPISGVMILRHDRQLYKDYDEKRIPITDRNGDVVVKGRKDQLTTATLFSPDWDLMTVEIEHQVALPMKVLLRKGKRIEFGIVDEAEQPVQGVALYPAPSKPLANRGYGSVIDFLGHRHLIPLISDAEGRIVWENAPEDALGYQMSSSKILNNPRREYAPSETPHRLVVRRAIPVTIEIVDDATGQDIVDFRIIRGSWMKTNRSNMWEWSHQRAEKDWTPGRYESNLASLDRLVQYRIEADGYKFERTQIFDPEKLQNQNITTTVRLKKLSPFSGAVLSPDGSPARNATIATRIVDYDERVGLRIVANEVDMSTATSEATTDESGRFQLNPPDRHFVCFVSHPSGYAYLPDVEMDRQSEIRLTAWGRIEGRLKVKQQPAKQITVRLGIDHLHSDYDQWGRYDRPGYENVTQTNDEGNYRFEYVLAGSIVQHIVYDPSIIDHRTAYYRDIRLNVAAGQTVNASMDPFPVSLTGRYLFPEGARAGKSRSTINITRKADAAGGDPQMTLPGFTRDVHQMVFPTDGRFEFHQLIPGTYELTARLEIESPSKAHFIRDILVIDPEKFQPATNQIDLGEIQLPRLTK